MRNLLAIVVGLVCATHNVWAAPPKPKGFFFPTGGQIGQTFSATAAGEFDPWPVEVAIDGAGVQLIPEKDPGKFRVEIAADALPSVRWARLFNAEGASSPMPLLVGALAENSETEPNNSPPQAQAVTALPVTINGRLHTSADVDIVAVTLEAGQTLIADLQAHRQLGVPMDGVLQLLSPAGFVLQQNDDAGGLDPRIVYTAQQACTVLIRLFAFPADPKQDITLWHDDRYVYRLTLTTGSFLDHCFPLAVERGKETAIELIGWNLTDAQRCQVLTIPTDRLEQWIFQPTIAGDALIRGMSSATLVEHQPNSPTQPQSLPLPCVVNGRVGEPRDIDVYAVELHKDHPLLVRVESRELGFPLYPVLTITSAADGKQLLKKDDHDKQRGLEAIFTPAADGLYHLAVTDLLRQGSPRHVYRLTLTTEKDYELTIAASEFKVASGDTLEIPVQVARQLDFADEIEVDVEGLPEGATCSAMHSKFGDDSAKEVKLKIIAGDAPFNGRITIQGKSLAVPSMQRTAIVKPLLPASFTAKPWLTIAAKK